MSFFEQPTPHLPEDFSQLQAQYGVAANHIQPLSYNQQAMWFLQKMDPTTTIYNVGFSFHVQAALDAERVKQALQLIVDRHEVLRTIYPAINGTPVQLILSEQEVSFAVVDARDWTDVDVERSMAACYQKRFDLACDPVMQTRLYILSETHLIIQILAHHIAIDAWSIWLIVDELRTNFATLQAGNLPSPKPLRSQYTDFMRWQKEMLAAENGQAMANFWRERLAGDLPTLRLPGERLQAASEEPVYTEITFEIDPETVQKVRRLAFSEGASTYSLLLAAFQVLLSKYSGQQDIVVGSPLHGRGSVRFAKLVGYFVNLGMMRGNVDPDQSFRAFLKQMNEQVQAVLLHQHYPFALIAKEKLPANADSSQSLVQVMFNLIKAPKKLQDLTAVWLDDSGTQQIVLDGLVIDRLKVDAGYGINGIDLNFQIVDFKERMIARIGYNQVRIPADMIANMMTHFRQLVEDIVSNPDQLLGNLSLLTAAEREKILHTWNKTAVSLPPHQFIHTLFAAQAQRTPAATAVSFAGQQVTYAELNQKANQLAHYLRRRGVAPDTLVGICVTRSLEMVIGVLGILKAGGAYVPLDPTYPPERLHHMLQDAQPALLLTQAKLADDLFTQQDSQLAATIPPSTLIRLDTEWARIAAESTENPPLVNTAENLVYVLYTSGSTGQPKGVALPHRALTNLTIWQLKNSAAALGNKTLQFASLNFDVSCQEMFTTWCAGGTLLLVEEETRQDTARLLNFIRQQAVNRLFLPFVALQQLAEAAAIYHQYPASLQEIITAGEQLQINPTISAFFQKLPQCTLVNQYGPTESHVVTAYKLGKAVSEWPSLPPIGRPLANTQIYLLDAACQPVPVGVPGELYIGGVCLARHYLNKPTLTADRFIDNPFADTECSSRKLYKTGDLARYLPDGNIEFLGRTDSQVKIRGYRIELGEVETAVLQHPDIQQTAVVAHTADAKHKQLVAYVVPQAGKNPPVEVLRQFLQQKLPTYMIPAVFIPLDRIPLTPSGKINRSALPRPDMTRPELAQTYVKPRTPQEQLLADVWATVLQVERVGIYDNFFDLGGHSLLATQVASRMEKATGISLSLRALFDTPTIAGISDTLNQMRRATELPLPPLLPVSREEQIPLSFAQERMWFLHQLAPNDHAYHIPITLTYRQAINREALQKAFDSIVVRHESLRTIFPVEDGVPQQKILPPYPVTIHEIDLSTVPAADQETAVIQLIQADSKLPHDLAAAPPWRFTLFHLNDESYIFYLGFHHIIFDQWSTVVLWQDFYTLYLGYCADETPQLPSIDIQYADFSVWQRSWLQGPILADFLAYWREQLADVAVLDMPTDHPRPPVQTFNGATEFLYLSPTLTAALRTCSRHAQVSPFMLMLAAFKLLLARYSGQTDIAVGVPVANRHYLEVEPIIGTFVNTLVVRTALDNEPTFAQLLNRVRHVLLDAYAYQDLPFEKLVSEIVETRDLSHTPLVQVLFNMTNAPFDHTQAAASPISFMAFERGAAQFDLSVTIVMEEHLPIAPQIALEYNTTLYERETIQRFLAHYETLLAAVTEDTQLPISSYEILSAAERDLLLNQWNQTETAYPSRCLHELFQQQAQRTPQKTAVSFQEQALTYKELDERSNQLAYHLQHVGVGPETVVGLFVERSLDMVVALLGILKAGGAYLPLDPGFPADRLAFMVEDAQVDVILTQAALLTVPPADQVAHAICLDTDWPQIEQLSTASLPQTAVARNRAYIIYTSGSTGKPKGVQIEQRNVVNFMTAMQQQPGISADDILLSVTTLSFDISVLEIFLPLLNGAQVVIADRLTAVDGRELIKAIKQVQATILQATPTTWSMLVDAGWHNTPSLRKALCGGEALTHELAQSILARDVELWNMYGPTETTIWSSVQQISANQSQISIGKPIANNSFYVLDAHGQPVPIGVAGELYIGGDGVARGYLNRPELTDERFVPDPYTEWSSTGRMYRTGDLVRYLASGTVEYLGRIDFQVKIHGHRIELGEIEAALSRQPHVGEVVVTVHTTPNDAILAAYIVPHDEEERPTITALREILRAQLTDYMIPSAFVYLDEFPLTPNRKINRKALPAPDSFRPDLESSYMAPRTDLETVLADILAALLGLEKVGIHDDFFELGGHSLQATRYVARVGQALRMELSLWSFLRAPNVADLAAHLAELPEAARIKRIAQLRVKMAAMSPEEVQQLLAQKSGAKKNEALRDY